MKKHIFYTGTEGAKKIEKAIEEYLEKKKRPRAKGKLVGTSSNKFIKRDK